MRRAGLGWVLAVAAAAQGAVLEPLDAQEGFGGLVFGIGSETVQGLLPWGQQDGLDIHVAEMEPEIGGVRFEARMLRFWDNRLIQMQYVTTDFNASRNYFQQMVAAYGRPASKTGANSYEWLGRKLTASYVEDGKTAVVTYGSVALLKERQRKAKRK